MSIIHHFLLPMAKARKIEKKWSQQMKNLNTKLFSSNYYTLCDGSKLFKKLTLHYTGGKPKNYHEIVLT